MNEQKPLSFCLFFYKFVAKRAIPSCLSGQILREILMSLLQFGTYYGSYSCRLPSECVLPISCFLRGQAEFSCQLLVELLVGGLSI